MSTYNMNLTLENIRTITVMFLDIFIMWLVLYYAIRIVRNNTRTIQIFKGILLVVIADSIAQFLGLKTVAYVTNIFINWGFLAIIIIFQPEIRSLLERLGKSNVFSRITTLTGNEKENLVDQIVKATMLLSQDQTGALICIEQSRSLDDFIATGTKLNSDVTAELLTSIFVTSTPLHDGAVIIQGDKIACASAYFPPTNLELPSRYGARHRAAIGISEITDAVTIVVSEETGAVSITEGGKIISVDRRQLRDYLLRVICGETTEVSASKKKTAEPQEQRTIIVEDTKPAAKPKMSKKDKEAKSFRRQDTSLLNTLAIKKQDIEQAKIETEEVQPAQTAKENTVKKGIFRRSGNDSSKNTAEHAGSEETARLQELEEEASQIKLPKKKERPVPSYPQDSAGIRIEQEEKAREEAIRAQQAREARERRQKEQLEKARKAAAEAAKAREAAEQAKEKELAEKAASEFEEKKKKEAERIARLNAQMLEMQKQKEAEESQIKAPAMTAEEVRAAREKSKEMLSGRTQNQNADKTESFSDSSGYTEIPGEQKKPETIDTTKLDLPKMVGFESELDQTLKMVDSMKDDKPNASDDGKGGK